MADKVIEINQEKRLTKQALKLIQESVAELDVGAINTLIVVRKEANKPVVFEAYGLDWEAVGQTRAVLDAISQTMIADDLGVDDEDLD